jgi:hypothetical protein
MPDALPLVVSGFSQTTDPTAVVAVFGRTHVRGLTETAVAGVRFFVDLDPGAAGNVVRSFSRAMWCGARNDAA